MADAMASGILSCRLDLHTNSVDIPRYIPLATLLATAPEEDTLSGQYRPIGDEERNLSIGLTVALSSG